MSAAPLAVLCRGEAETERRGRELGLRLEPGALVSLEGELGAGKTVFVRGLAEGLGHPPDSIASPSFVLAIEHAGGRLSLLHVDLYRLAEGAGIDDLGIDEALARGWVVAVEWGERLPAVLRGAGWRVVIATAEIAEPDARSLVIVPPAGA